MRLIVVGLVVGLASLLLGGCVYNPYTGLWQPAGYYPYGYPYRPYYPSPYYRPYAYTPQAHPYAGPYPSQPQYAPQYATPQYGSGGYPGSFGGQPGITAAPLPEPPQQAPQPPPGVNPGQPSDQPPTNLNPPPHQGG